MSGLSIGYAIGNSTKTAAGNELTELASIELSRIVARGANDRALVLRCNAGVKADQRRVVPSGIKLGHRLVKPRSRLSWHSFLTPLSKDRSSF